MKFEFFYDDKKISRKRAAVIYGVGFEDMLRRAKRDFGSYPSISVHFQCDDGVLFMKMTNPFA